MFFYRTQGLFCTRGTEVLEYFTLLRLVTSLTALDSISLFHVIRSEGLHGSPLCTACLHGSCGHFFGISGTRWVPSLPSLADPSPSAPQNFQMLLYIIFSFVHAGLFISPLFPVRSLHLIHDARKSCSLLSIFK